MKYMTQEHKCILASKCSKFKNAAMPLFDDSSESPSKVSGNSSIINSNTISPVSNAAMDDAATSAKTHRVATVSPDAEGKALEGASVKATKPHNSKPSAQLLETHRKWQETAEALGGPGSRIIVSKPEAKKLVYAELYDAFRPMNITDIYKVRLRHISRRFTESAN